jgi:V8-like Glu-specific endopeptidase
MQPDIESGGLPPVRRAAVVLATLLSVAQLPALAAKPSRPRPPVGVKTTRALPSRAEVLDFWTKARRKAAVPVDVEVPIGSLGGAEQALSGGPAGEVAAEEPSGPVVWKASSSAEGFSSGAGPYPYSSGEVSVAYTAYPYSTHGKVFFTDPSTGGNYVCSGTAVTSQNESVVWTAGHCVHGGGTGAGWMTNWTFVPAYKDGARPLGTWVATQLFASSGWVTAGDFGYDMAAAIVAPDAAGTSLTDAVGGRGIQWNQPDQQTYHSYGYPAASPFTGGRLRYCDSALGERDPYYGGLGPDPLAIGCDMTGGSSGGGWVNDNGILLSLNSYGYDGLTDVMHGPYFGVAAQNLYETVQIIGVAPSPSPTPTASPTPTSSPTPTATPTPSESPSPEPSPSPTPTPEPTPAPDTRAPHLTRVDVTPATFTPNGDGRNDKARLLFSLDESASVTVKVVSRFGGTVRVLGRNVRTPADSYLAVWNGKKDGGSKAKAGVYKFKVWAVDAAGNRSATAVEKVTLRR